MIRTEKEYRIKIVDYKGKSIDFKPPKKKSDFYKTLVSLARLYERAKSNNFLTKDLFLAIKAYAQALYNVRDALFIAFKNPPLLRRLKEIVNSDPEDLKEEVIYGKVRVHENRTCSVCGCYLVYPAYIVFKKDGREIRRSNPVGIKCLNHMVKKLHDLVEYIEINWKGIKEDIVQIKKITQTQTNLELPL